MGKLMFSYGRNLNIDEMKYRCPAAKPVGRALLRGYRLDFRGAYRGVATIIMNEKSSVWGGIWEITDQCENSLDRFEGFPGWYEKILVDVELVDENYRKVKAMTYQLSKGKFNPPSREYLNTIREGYMNFLLPMHQLDLAIKSLNEQFGVSKPVDPRRSFR